MQLLMIVISEQSVVGIDTYENHIYRLIEVGLNGTAVTTLTINDKFNKKLSEKFLCLTHLIILATISTNRI